MSRSEALRLAYTDLELARLRVMRAIEYMRTGHSLSADDCAEDVVQQLAKISARLHRAFGIKEAS